MSPCTNCRIACLLIITTFFLAGCDREDQIQTYDAPKDRAPQASATTQATSQPPTEVRATPAEGMPETSRDNPSVGASETAQTSPATHPSNQGHAAQPADARGVTWTLPQNWSEITNPSPMRIATIKAADAEMIASRLNAKGWGNLIDNINRWRGQTGLPPIDEVSKQPSTTTGINGHTWTTYDISGPQKRMIVSYVDNGESVWFFRLGGTSDAVEAQKTSLDSFLKSIQFQ